MRSKRRPLDTCIKGDMDHDGVVAGDLDDIPLFVNFLLGDDAVCVSAG